MNIKKIILLFITIILLFGVSDAYAASCIKGNSCSKCNTVCQYKKGDDTILFEARENGSSAKKNTYEVLYMEKFNGVGAVGGLGYTNKYKSNLYSFDELVSQGYADFLNINNDLEVAAQSQKICTKYAYQINKAKTCFDDDGKACKEKYGNKIKATYTEKSGTEGVIDGCGFYEGQFEEEVVTETHEQEFINSLTEHKIVIPDPDVGDGEGCEGLFGPVITEDINTVLKYIKYLGPILIIVLSILDFIKVVASGANDEFNKVWKRLLTRLVVAILLFFVVDLVKLLFHVFGITVPDNCLK